MAKKKSSILPRQPSKAQAAHKNWIERKIAEEKAKQSSQFSQSRETSNSPPHSAKKMVRLPPGQYIESTSSTRVPIKIFRPLQPAAVSKPEYPGSRVNQSISRPLDPRHTQSYDLIARNASVALPYVRKGTFPFLELPGELRNKIYDIVIPHETYQLRWINNNHKSCSLTYYIPGKESASTRRLRKDVLEHRKATRNLRSPTRKTAMNDVYNRASPVSLLWVCKQMYPEAASMFYGKSTLILRRLKTMRHFLNTTSPLNKQAIKSLSLVYHAYGHPVLTKNTMWKTKHDLSWEDLCERISNECPNITTLSLDLRLNRCPIAFDCIRLEEIAFHPFTQWMLSLWHFMDKEIPLARFICQIHSNIIEDTVLEVESQNLRREFMGEFWDEKVETKKRDAFGNDKEKKPRQNMVLNLLDVA